MSGQDTTTVTFEPEIELTISGTPQRAEPDVGIMPDYHDDVGIDEAVVLVLKRNLNWVRDAGGHIVHPPYTTHRHDLCAGLDAKAKAIVLANLLEAFGEDRAAEVLGEGE